MVYSKNDKLNKSLGIQQVDHKINEISNNVRNIYKERIERKQTNTPFKDGLPYRVTLPQFDDKDISQIDHFNQDEHIDLTHVEVKNPLCNESKLLNIKRNINFNSPSVQDTPEINNINLNNKNNNNKDNNDDNDNIDDLMTQLNTKTNEVLSYKMELKDLSNDATNFSNSKYINSKINLNQVNEKKPNQMFFPSIQKEYSTFINYSKKIDNRKELNIPLNENQYQHEPNIEIEEDNNSDSRFCISSDSGSDSTYINNDNDKKYTKFKPSASTVCADISKILGPSNKKTLLSDYIGNQVIKDINMELENSIDNNKPLGRKNYINEDGLSYLLKQYPEIKSKMNDIVFKMKTLEQSNKNLKDKLQQQMNTHELKMMKYHDDIELLNTAFNECKLKLDNDLKAFTDTFAEFKSDFQTKKNEMTKIIENLESKVKEQERIISDNKNSVDNTNILVINFRRHSIIFMVIFAIVTYYTIKIQERVRYSI